MVIGIGAACRKNRPALLLDDDPISRKAYKMVPRRKSRKKGKSKKMLNHDVDNPIFYRPESYCLASCDGWLVVLDHASGELWLVHLFSMRKIRLPPMVDSFSKCILSSSPEYAQCTVLFFGFEDHNGHRTCKILSCQPIIDQHWKEPGCYPHLNFPCCDAISFNRKVYMIDDNGRLFEIILSKTELEFVTILETVISPKLHLVESLGELYIVNLCSASKIEIFKIDFYRYRATQIYSLGDRIFFIKNKDSISASAKKLGIRGNSIYFMEDGNDEASYAFHLGEDSLSVTTHQPRYSTLWFTDSGLMPGIRITDNSRGEDQSEEERESELKVDAHDHNRELIEQDECIWSKLPIDIQKSIAQVVCKGLWGYVNFRAVSRWFRSIAPPCCLRSSADDSTAIKHPWLMYIQREKGICIFYDPRDNFSYHMYDAELLDCTIHFSKDGWLLISKGESMFLYEPFAKKRTNIPDNEDPGYFKGIFTSLSSTDQRIHHAVIGVTYICPGSLSLTCSGPKCAVWYQDFVTTNDSFRPLLHNPVFFKGFLFVLGQDGRLGKVELEETLKWSIFDKPQPICCLSQVSQSFLVLSEELELLSVFVGNVGKWVKVFRLDLSVDEWVWEELKSLGNKVLFVSETTSVAVNAEQENMKNKIYFPIFTNANENIMVYCLETQKFQTVVGDYSSPNFYDTNQKMNSTWIQPKLVPTLRGIETTIAS